MSGAIREIKWSRARARCGVCGEQLELYPGNFQQPNVGNECANKLPYHVSKACIGEHRRKKAAE